MFMCLCLYIFIYVYNIYLSKYLNDHIYIYFTDEDNSKVKKKN